MLNRASSINKAKILKKIKFARKIAEKMKKSKNHSVSSDVPLKLKEIADKIELAYNDVTVKRFKWQASSGMMRKWEIQLDELLLEAVDIRSSKLETKIK